MSPMSNPSFDHSYELPLRRNLLLLLDLLGRLRFIAEVLLDRLGVASWQGEVHLPGQLWGWGGEHASDATLEHFLEARLWETGTRSPLTTTRYRRRRVALAQPADGKLAAEGDAEGAAAVCAICLAGLESGDLETVVELCSCSHAFHDACIDAWVRSGDDDAATCPLCRAPCCPRRGTTTGGEQSLSRVRSPGD